MNSDMSASMGAYAGIEHKFISYPGVRPHGV